MKPLKAVLLAATLSATPYINAGKMHDAAVADREQTTQESTLEASIDSPIDFYKLLSKANPSIALETDNGALLAYHTPLGKAQVQYDATTTDIVAQLEQDGTKYVFTGKKQGNDHFLEDQLIEVRHDNGISSQVLGLDEETYTNLEDPFRRAEFQYQTIIRLAEDTFEDSATKIGQDELTSCVDRLISEHRDYIGEIIVDSPEKGKSQIIVGQNSEYFLDSSFPYALLEYRVAQDEDAPSTMKLTLACLPGNDNPRGDNASGFTYTFKNPDKTDYIDPKGLVRIHDELLGVTLYKNTAQEFFDEQAQSIANLAQRIYTQGIHISSEDRNNDLY